MFEGYLVSCRLLGLFFSDGFQLQVGQAFRCAADYKQVSGVKSFFRRWVEQYFFISLWSSSMEILFIIFLLHHNSASWPSKNTGKTLLSMYVKSPTPPTTSEFIICGRRFFVSGEIDLKILRAVPYKAALKLDQSEQPLFNRFIFFYTLQGVIPFL
ncbi:MAG: hypothetical protein ACOY4I_05750 [Bacillota bacterium]